MPDPAGIIAATISDLPCRDGAGGDWQLKSAMSLPGGPDLAARIAKAVVRALADAGWTLVPPPVLLPSLPSADQMRAWLTANDWRPGVNPGREATAWYPVKGRPVPIPHEDDDLGLIQGAVERIAGRMSIPVDQVIAEMTAGG